MLVFISPQYIHQSFVSNASVVLPPGGSSLCVSESKVVSHAPDASCASGDGDQSAAAQADCTLWHTAFLNRKAGPSQSLRPKKMSRASSAKVLRMLDTQANCPTMSLCWAMVTVHPAEGSHPLQEAVLRTG